MPVETEIKFRLDDLDGLTHRLKAAGFTLQTPRSFETNVLYDTPDRRLRSRTEILRIRNYAGSCLLTHKRLPDPGSPARGLSHRGGTPDPAKIPISTASKRKPKSLTATPSLEVFHSIGLDPAFCYEKWRSKWTDGQGYCDVDETPIGNFAELEGTSQWIDATAARLGIVPSQYITLSYGRLFDLWRDQCNSPAQHLTFADCSR